MAPSRRGWAVAAALAGAGCAATNPSTPLPQETLVVLNAGDQTLSVLTLPAPESEKTIVLGSLGAAPVALAARGGSALVTTGAGSSVVRVDLNAGAALVIRLPAAAGAAGAAFVNDTLAYIANPTANRATRLNLRTGDTASVAAGQTPTAVAVTRGKVFVADANLNPDCAGPLPCVAGPSWLTVIDPDRNAVVDSVPLPGPGNAMAIEVGGDGLLYVLNAGPGGDQPGRLSIVDPVLRQEVGNFGGFGILPSRLASDGRERLFVVSAVEGLMEFNTRTRRVVRGAGGSAIPLQDGVAAAVDHNGLVYAVEAGSCAIGLGRVRVFRPDLTEARVVPVGPCSADAAIVQLPPVPTPP
jgi:hypothetical protein